MSKKKQQKKLNAFDSEEIQKALQAVLDQYNLEKDRLTEEAFERLSEDINLFVDRTLAQLNNELRWKLHKLADRFGAILKNEPFKYQP